MNRSTLLASYMPFVDIRFRAGLLGKVWQKTWYRDTPLILRGVYACVFVFFAPVVFLIGLPFVILGKAQSKKKLQFNSRTVNE